MATTGRGRIEAEVVTRADFWELEEKIKRKKILLKSGRFMLTSVGVDAHEVLPVVLAFV